MLLREADDLPGQGKPKMTTKKRNLDDFLFNPRLSLQKNGVQTKRKRSNWSLKVSQHTYGSMTLNLVVQNPSPQKSNPKTED